MDLNISRRSFLQTTTAGIPLLANTMRTSASEPKTILLRSGWQAVNIGDIAHSFGAIQLLQKHIPEAKIIHWPVSRNDDVDALLHKNFPNLEIVYGRYDADGMALDDSTRRAVEEADLFIHGSGAGVYLHPQLEAWRNRIQKPYGILGTTISSIPDRLKGILDGAAFVFCRETKSVQNVRDAGIEKSVVDFAPDATFAMDIRNDEKASAYLSEHGLQPKRFICVIPRLRYTPYYKFKKVNWTEEEIARKEAVNETHKEADHAKLRDTIVAWVRETGMKVLVCPEMTYQIDIIDPLVVDPLPSDVKQNVVARKTYWMPDEASSVYRRAHTVVSIECHSPIIAAGQGTPCFYIRQPEDTIKGQMYYDLGLDDWVFEIDETKGSDIAERLLEVYADYDGALVKLQEAMDRARQRHTAAAHTIRTILKI